MFKEQPIEFQLLNSPPEIEFEEPGSLLKHVFGCYCDKDEPALVYYPNDCATQSILHILWDFKPGLRGDYREIAAQIKDDKQNHPSPLEFTKEEREEWLNNHILPFHQTTIRVLMLNTGIPWWFEYYDDNPEIKLTLEEFAIKNREFPYLGAISEGHISAVKSGIIYDCIDARKERITGVVAPSEYIYDLSL